MMNEKRTCYDKEQKRYFCEEKTNQLIYYAKKYIHTPSLDPLKCSFVCINSDLLRGCLHPSPIADLIVGNIKRGRRLKGDVWPNNLSHRYLFDDNNRLVCIESVHQGKVTYVENLFYNQNSRIGVKTYDGKVYGICEEIFDNGRILSVAILSYFEMEGGYLLCNLHWEEYSYNEDGLCSCDFVSNYTPGSNHFSFSQYKFEVKDGFLQSYVSNSGILYSISKKREANGKGYYFKGTEGSSLDK